ncbi:MAG: hypothetical protein ACKV2U_26265 [Bryobacteraceae bacterium]
MSKVNTREWIEERTAVLAASSQQTELEVAATELASADDPAALDALGTFLHDAGFLARLDDLDDPGRKMMHLSPVLLALIKHASPEIVPLCMGLINDPVFLADRDRKIWLLQALSAVTPMTAETAEIFRRANLEGYFGSCACLLARNSSPVALALFLSMMLEKEVEVEMRVDLLHEALVPIRNRIPIMEVVGRLASKNPGEELANAAIESIYDYQVTWRSGHPERPPPWRSSASETLQYLVNLAAYLKSHFKLPESLQQAMDRTTAMAHALLARRSA